MMQSGPPTTTELASVAVGAIAAIAAIMSVVFTNRTARRALTQDELKNSMQVTLNDFSRSEALRNAISLEIARAERSQSAQETSAMREAITSAMNVFEKQVIDGCRRIFVDERVHALDLEILRKEDVAIRAFVGDLSHTTKRHTGQIALLIEAMMNRGIAMRPRTDEETEGG